MLKLLNSVTKISRRQQVHDDATDSKRCGQLCSEHAGNSCLEGQGQGPKKKLANMVKQDIKGFRDHCE